MAYIAVYKSCGCWLRAPYIIIPFLLYDNVAHHQHCHLADSEARVLS